MYASDFRSVDALGTQLTLLRSARKDEDINLKSTVLYLPPLSSEQRQYFAEVIKLVKLILVMPATNATSEGRFSALRRLKTWLRATEAQQRLNWCMVLHVHKDRTDELEIADLASEFVSRNAKNAYHWIVCVDINLLISNEHKLKYSYSGEKLGGGGGLASLASPWASGVATVGPGRA